jgi:Sulfatase-modifying factor enzyme 1
VRDTLASDIPDASIVTVPSSVAAGAARSGMTWIPPGVLSAGTPSDRVPRIADEELPGTNVAMGGFYIDLLPYPNEPGAIPTTNLSRDEAARLCESKGKRLCTELEWERACKGPENTTYDYGNEYRAGVCGTGVSAELAAKRPAGERVACKSPFGVLEMHGGVWEWTDSLWGRASGDSQLGVLRGGNAAAGELVGRCANGIARPLTTKAPTMGLRCCAGPRNEAHVELEVQKGTPLERSAKPEELAAPLLPIAEREWKPVNPVTLTRAWTWRPAPNEVLVIGSGCGKEKWWMSCGLVIARPDGAGAHLVAHFETSFEAPEVALFGEPRKIRAKGTDAQGPFVRDLVYAYGRVTVSDAKR